MLFSLVESERQMVASNILLFSGISEIEQMTSVVLLIISLLHLFNLIVRWSISACLLASGSKESCIFVFFVAGNDNDIILAR